MAKLSNFRRDAARVAEGEWVTVGPADDPFKLRIRGFTAAYRDTLARLKLAKAREINRTVLPGQPTVAVDNLPPSIDDACQAEALSRECLIDVEGLQHDDGRDMTVDELRELLPTTPVLLVLAIQAAGRVGDDRATQAKAAEGN